jgi:uncharacterized membrane-anchored protein
MNFAKLFQGIIVGGLFSGILSAICAAYIAFTSDTIDSVGLTGKDVWWLVMLYAGFFGLIAGGILGGIVSALNLGLIAAGLCGFLITAIPGILLYLINHYFSPGNLSADLDRFGVFFIAITTLTAIFVSYIQMSFFKGY